MKSYEFIVFGKVQHVFYRKSISQALQRLGIQGYVRNRKDKTVEVVVRIYEDQYDTIIATLEAGSPISQVDHIEHRLLDADDIIYDGFEIRQ